jgi:hypothetical protein
MVPAARRRGVESLANGAELYTTVVLRQSKREILREICGLDECLDDSFNNDASATLAPGANTRDTLRAEDSRAEWHDHRASHA